MRKTVILGLIIVGLSILIGCSSKNEGKENKIQEKKDRISSILSTKVKNCVRISPIKFYLGEDLLDYINGAGKVYFTYGFEMVGTTEYALPDTNLTMVVDIYQMSTPQNSFGIYSYNRYREASIDSTLGGEGFYSGYSVDFYDSIYYIHIQLFETSDEVVQEMLDFAKEIDSRIIAQNSQPSVLDALPEKHKIPHTETYIHEHEALDGIISLPDNPFMLSSSTEVAVADYQNNSEDFYNLFYIFYPDSVSLLQPFNNFRNFAENDSLSHILDQDQKDIILFSRDDRYHFVRLDEEFINGGLNFVDEESMRKTLTERLGSEQ
jgi:hypothetical protein